MQQADMFAATSCGPGPGPGPTGTMPKHKSTISHIWLIVLLMIVAVVSTNAEKNKNYHIQTLCKSAFAQTIYRKIEGALVWSQDERNLNCLTTFQTHSILQHFLLRFDMLQLDCNDHLYVYDGGSAVGSPKYNVSCRDTKQLFGVLVTQTNFVTLKYVTDNWGTDINGFKLVITAIKDPKHVCQSFLCASRELCIHSSLRCDGVNHCGDDSDEESCRDNSTTRVLGLELTWFVLISVSCFLAIGAVLAALVICLCRQSTSESSDPHQTIDMNGSTKYVHKMHLQNSTTLSGNLHHPADKHGYNYNIQHNLVTLRLHPIWLANS